MEAVHLSRLLVDTRVWLWMFIEPERLGAATTALVTDPASELTFSVACGWEVALKLQLGKLRIPGGLDRFNELARRRAVHTLGITLEHVVRVAELPLHHRDPFDRILIAQAKSESLTLVTADPMQRRYDVATLDATQ